MNESFSNMEIEGATVVGSWDVSLNRVKLYKYIDILSKLSQKSKSMR